MQPGVLREPVAAVSVGLLEGVALLDLVLRRGPRRQVDLNLVATAAGDIIEVQGTAEGEPMTRKEHDALVDLGLVGIDRAGAESQQRVARAAGVDLARLLAP